MPAGTTGERMSDVADQVKAFVLSNFLFGQADQMPDDRESLVDSGVIDSTGILELIEFLELSFAITVADSETVPENLDSIISIARFVRSKQASAA